MEKYQTFIERQSEDNPPFAFWSSYINMAQLLLLFVRGTHKSDWDLHLAAVRFMMSWFFSYDRFNYSRYLPAHWLEMVSLPVTHPDCHAQLTSRGQWTVQQQDRYAFSSIACDQAIEQTLNRDSKTKVGLTGFSLNRGAVHRWILAQNERAAIARQCEIMAGNAPDV